MLFVSRLWLSFPVLLFLLMSGPLLGATRLIRFNVSPQGYPPYTIVKADGTVSGIMWDVLTRIAHRHHILVKAMRIPRKRVDSFILNDHLDATARAREWTSHPEKFLFTAPIVEAEEVFFSRTSDPFDYKSPASLKGETLVTHLGYEYPALQPMFSNGEIQRFDVQTDVGMFRDLLETNHFRVLVAERHVGLWIIRQHHWKGRFVYDAAPPLTRLAFPLMFSKRWAGFVKVFNRDLERMRRNGQLKAIVDQYL